MTKLLITLAAVMFFSTVSPADGFGPAELPPEDADIPVSFALGFTHFQGRFEPTGDSENWENETLKQDRLFLQINHDVPEFYQIYWRIGGADLEVDDAFILNEKRDFSSDYELFTSVGLKGVVYDTPKLSLAPFLQAGYYFDYKDEADVTSPWGGTDTMTLEYRDLWEINVGISAQTKIEYSLSRAGLIREITLYCGPLLYYSTARVKLESESFDFSDSTRIEEKGNIGAFSGVSVPLPANMRLDLEGQYKSRLSGGFSFKKFF